MKAHYLKTMTLTLFLMVSTCLMAQEKDTTKTIRNVEIERDYTPEIEPVDRPKIDINIDEPPLQKRHTKYSTYRDNYIVPKASMLLLNPKDYGSLNRENPKSGFFRVGAGVLFDWLADFWYPIWNTDDGYIDIIAHHDGIYRVGTPAKELYNTNFGFNFIKNFDQNQLYLSAKYSNESFNYYGNDTTIQPNHYSNNLDTIFQPTQSFNRGNITIGFRTKERNSNNWLWDTHLCYILQTTKNNLSEHNINAVGQIDKVFDTNSLLAEVGVNSYFYSDNNFIPQIKNQPKSQWQSNTMLFVKPAFIMDFDNLKLKLGAKTFFTFGKRPIFAIAPNVKIDYFLDNFLNLYAGLDGNYQVNSLEYTTTINRYYNLSETTQNTYTPIDLFGGFRVKILKGLLLDASIGYKYVMNAIFFNNSNLYLTNKLNGLEVQDSCYNKYFEAVQKNGSLFNANISLTYNIREHINIFASMEYNRWSFDQVVDATTSRFYAWHTPEWRVNVGTEFKVGKGFFANANIYCASKMKAEQINRPTQKIIELPAIYDLNIGLGYNISKDFSFFSKFNNILAVMPNLNYYNWYGYQTMGFNALVGLTVQF